MKRLKDKPEHYSSKQWVRINYKTLSASADGFYIMKREVYEDNRKKFEKLFRDCLIEIIYDYPVTMYDICYSALRELRGKFIHYETLLNLNRKRLYVDEEMEDKYTMELKHIHTFMVRIERKLIWEN